MYINDLGIKEINRYYAQRGGQRLNGIKSFANYIETAKADNISKARSQAAASADAEESTDAESKCSCCSQCQLTSQLLRMMTNTLYSQNSLGYPAMGSGALAAYQSLSKYFGSSVFS